jgi:hypothetical protein
MTDEEEDAEEEGPVLPGPDSGWIPVATNVDGKDYWESGYEDIGRCRDALKMLQQLHGHTPDWGLLLRELEQLAVLTLFEYPLNDFGDFLEIDCFLNISYSNTCGWSDYLFIDMDLTDPRCQSLLWEFAELTRRLKCYEPLRNYWQYM